MLVCCMGTGTSERAELAERWRVAGRLLRRIDPVAYEALLLAAEVIVAETPEERDEISLSDRIC